jgi:hypothetical protein
MLNFTFNELTVVKTEIVIVFLCLFNYNYALQKNDFTKSLPIFYLLMYFWGLVMPCSCKGTFYRKEGGIQVLAGLAPSLQLFKHLELYWEPPGQAKIQQKVILVDSLQWKIHSTTFNQMILALINVLFIHRKIFCFLMKFL